MIGAVRRTPWWVWVSLLPLGLGAWTPLVPGMRLRRRIWSAWGALWAGMAVAGWMLAGSQDGGSLAGGLVIVAWAGAIATCMTIRAEYLRVEGSSWSAAKEAARERLETREEAVRLATQEPELAAELGVGRPDRDHAQHAGVVDVNHAPASVLGDLPGIDEALATRIIETRAELGGFSSVADLGTVLDLDGATVERLRQRVVFLPR